MVITRKRRYEEECFPTSIDVLEVEATVTQLFQTDGIHVSKSLQTKTKAGWCLREGLIHILSVENGNRSKKNNDDNDMAAVARRHPLPTIYTSLEYCRDRRKIKVAQKKLQEKEKEIAIDNGDKDDDEEGDEDDDKEHEPRNCFQSLCKIVAGQQLAGAAALTIWKRLLKTTGYNLTPSTILALVDNANTTQRHEHKCDHDNSLLQSSFQEPSGLSRAKARSILEIARRFHTGQITDTFLTSAPEPDVRQRLLDIKGVGPWTCDIFLMFYLERSDILPAGDLGVRKGMVRFFSLCGSKKGKRGDTLCPKNDLELIQRTMEPYRPYRSLAAYYMWKVADTKDFYCGGGGDGGNGKKRASLPKDSKGG